MTDKKDYCPEARTEGAIAYNDGAEPAANPYPTGTAEHREWRRGWKYARHQTHPTKRQTPKRPETIRIDGPEVPGHYWVLEKSLHAWDQALLVQVVKPGLHKIVDYFEDKKEAEKRLKQLQKGRG